MKGVKGVEDNSHLVQVFTLGNNTKQGTFTDEPAADRIIHALADLTLTVKFKNGAANLVVAIKEGDDFGLDSTVDTITTTAAALLT